MVAWAKVLAARGQRKWQDRFDEPTYYCLQSKYAAAHHRLHNSINRCDRCVGAAWCCHYFSDVYERSLVDPCFLFLQSICPAMGWTYPCQFIFYFPLIKLYIVNDVKAYTVSAAMWEKLPLLLSVAETLTQLDLQELKLTVGSYLHG